MTTRSSHASCILLSRTGNAGEEKLAAAVAMLAEKNPTAAIVTTDGTSPDRRPDRFRHGRQARSGELSCWPRPKLPTRPTPMRTNTNTTIITTMTRMATSTSAATIITTTMMMTMSTSTITSSSGRALAAAAIITIIMTTTPTRSSPAGAKRPPTSTAARIWTAPWKSWTAALTA